MSETGDPHRPDLLQLEPWALELEESAPDGSDPQTREELARVVTRLRSLPDPEPPAGLSEAVMARVRAETQRPRLLHPRFGVPVASAGLALAAGVAKLGDTVIVTGSQPFDVAAPTNFLKIQKLDF